MLLLHSDTGMASGTTLRHGQCGLWVVATPMGVFCASPVLGVLCTRTLLWIELYPPQIHMLTCNPQYLRM